VGPTGGVSTNAGIDAMRHCESSFGGVAVVAAEEIKLLPDISCQVT